MGIVVALFVVLGISIVVLFLHDAIHGFPFAHDISIQCNDILKRCDHITCRQHNSIDRHTSFLVQSIGFSARMGGLEYLVQSNSTSIEWWWFFRRLLLLLLLRWWVWLFMCLDNEKCAMLMSALSTTLNFWPRRQQWRRSMMMDGLKATCRASKEDK